MLTTISPATGEAYRGSPSTTPETPDGFRMSERRRLGRVRDASTARRLNTATSLVRKALATHPPECQRRTSASAQSELAPIGIDVRIETEHARECINSSITVTAARRSR